MLNNNSKYILLAAIAAIAVACNNAKDESFLWGETEYYDDFLWVKHVPDTLKQTLCFDFNQDARDFMQEPLRLGIFKKDDNNKFVQLTENEIKIFANGQRVEGNTISVPASCGELEVGIVFSKEAENKIHYWYIRPIDSGVLDRINDKEANQMSGDDAIMEIKLKKQDIMNPLAEGLLIFCVVVACALLLWLLILKQIFFPTFRVTKLVLVGPEPYLNAIKLKRYRKLVLTSKNVRQGFFSRFFTGEINYSVNAMWTADVEFEPKDKRSIRIRPDKKEYFADTRILKINEEYTLENLNTKGKTIMRIS